MLENFPILLFEEPLNFVMYQWAYIQEITVRLFIASHCKLATDKPF